MDNNLRNSRHCCLWTVLFLCGLRTFAFAQESESSRLPKPSPGWNVLLVAGKTSTDPNLLRSVEKFKLQGPHAGHPFLLGSFETNGEWQMAEGFLTRTGGENALLELPQVEQFDLEGIFHSDRLGGMLFLLGWTPENSGYVLYNVTMKSKESGSPWHLCRFENGRFVAEEDREVARHAWEGNQSIRLSVRKKQLSLAIGKTKVLKDLPLSDYTSGNVMLGTYNTRYGPKNLRIQSLRIREVPED